MMSASSLDFEENEEGWWGLWCRVYRTPWAAIYHNPDFDEPVFNHATRVMPDRNVNQVIKKITEWFRRRHMDSYIYVTPFFKEQSWKDRLPKLGYKFDDEMVTLLLSKEEPRSVIHYRFSEVGKEGLREWATSYSLAFYNDSSSLKPTLKALKRVMRSKGATLHAAMHDGRAVGVMALFESHGALGLYCLGTVPGFREKGVATELLHYAAEKARKKANTLVLQTLRSDRLIPFYEKHGFTVKYVKKIYSSRR